MKSIKWRLVLIFLVIVFIVMLVAGTINIIRIEQTETDKAKTQLMDLASRIEGQIIQSFSEEDFQKELTSYSRLHSVLYQCNILDQEGFTIATTIAQSPPYPEYKNTTIVDAIANIQSFNKYTGAHVSTGRMSDWLAYAKPVTGLHGNKFIIFLQTDIRLITDTIYSTARTLVTTLIISLILTVVMGLIFAQTLTSPIMILTRKARELARGRLFNEVEVKSQDEIGQLSKSFNYMAKELTSTMSEMRSEKNKLEVILHNMTDGVLAFDQKGTLIHANAKSYDLLEETQITKLSSILSKFKLTLDDINELSPNESKFNTYDAGKIVVRASFMKYTNERNITEGIVIVLQDITEQKRLDDMRKEFVANVSHEIRTPLTTIKSYAETLIDGGIDNREISLEFLNIIDSETDKMAILVTDLLQLSQLDSRKIVLRREHIDLVKLTASIVKQNRILAQNKDQKLEFTEPENDIVLCLDTIRITQVINNILVNSMKYSSENALIKIFFSEDKSYYILHIEDNGFGIPSEDLPRIFERFYRVDKARSREMGGTGLGLSIAQELIKAHGGKIAAQSVFGEGTKMSLQFPKNEPVTEY